MDGSNTAIDGYLSQALALSASRGKVCSQKNPWGVRLRQGHASRRSSRLTNAIRHLHSEHGVIAEGVHGDTLKAPHPPPPQLLPCHPRRAALDEVLTLRNQTLMDGTGDGDRPEAEMFEDIPLKELPFLRGGGVKESI